MRLVPASLQPHVSKAIKFFQIHEEDAALHAFLLYLHTLRTNTVDENSTFVLKIKGLGFGFKLVWVPEFCQDHK